MRFLPSFGSEATRSTSASRPSAGARRARRFVSALILLAPLAALGTASSVACGPSFQALYEGDARFEHCYALDERSAVAMQDKSDCWRDWTMHYTYGQTRDRVEYAAARYRALSLAPQAPTDEAMMEAAPGEGRASSIAAPAPTSAFAPPPKTLTEADGGVDASTGLPGYADAAAPPLARPTTGTARPPGSDCGDQCTSTWNGCKDKCSGAKDCGVCTKVYKTCMKTCFAR